jgi:hypothetical protein
MILSSWKEMIMIPKIKLKKEKYGNYQFCVIEDFVDLWVKVYYPDKPVVVLFNSFNAFDTIPMLNILKRDNYKVYMEGIKSEYTYVEFDDVVKACDFVYGFDYKYDIKWVVYNNGKIHIRSK